MSLAIDLIELSLAHLEETATFFRRIYGATDKLSSKEYWSWLLSCNSLLPILATTARVNGGLAGFMALIPIELTRAGQVTTTYYAINVLVDPSHRGQNIFGRMIKLAETSVRDRHASLMGHPNRAAVGSWRRAGMDFVEPLRPVLLSPPLLSGRRMRPINDARDLEPVLRLMAGRPRDHWRPVLSAEYIAARYIDAPFARYRVHTIDSKGESVGYVITKQIRNGVNLWIYSEFASDLPSLAAGPFLTIAFVSKTLAHAARGTAWPLPAWKELPVFWTAPDGVVDHEQAAIGLAASDF